MKIEPGDLVLVRVKAFGPDHKIADRWEQTPYRVLTQLHNSPVFKVQPVDGEDENSVRVLHRNMLFPFQTIRAVQTAFSSFYARCFCRFSCSEVCAGLGNGCERFCTSRSLLGSYVHQESI